MAYIIKYSPESSKHYPMTRKKCRTRLGRILCFMIVLATILLVKLYGLPDCLIPGDAEVTKAALSNMVNRVQDGTELQAAVVGFCREIICNV